MRLSAGATHYIQLSLYASRMSHAVYPFIYQLTRVILPYGHYWALCTWTSRQLSEVRLSSSKSVSAGETNGSCCGFVLNELRKLSNSGLEWLYLFLLLSAVDQLQLHVLVHSADNFLFYSFKWHWGLNSGLCACSASTLPLSYIYFSFSETASH